MNILIVDDHPLVHQALFSSLKKQYPDSKIFIESTYTSAVSIIKNQNQIDIVILDLSLNGELKGYDLLNFIKSQIERPVRVIVLSMHSDPAYIKKALSLGACGYVVKNDPLHEVYNAIEDTLKDKIFCSPSATFNKTIKQSCETQELSPREKEIAKLVVAGYSSRDIADKLSISLRTAESHRHHIMKKMNAKNSIQLVHALRDCDLTQT